MKVNGNRYWRAGIVAGLVVALVAAAAGGIGWSIRPTGAAQNAAPRAQGDARIVVDHTSVALFPLIPLEVILSIRDWRMKYFDKSVGDNISAGLDCVGPNTIYNCSKPANAITSGLYIRANWAYSMFPPIGCGAWYELVDCFKTSLDSDPASWSVVMYGISYDAADSDDVLDYFEDTTSGREVGDYVSYVEGRLSPVVLWTASLKNSGPDITNQYNAAMRTYATEHGYVLFDLADIESHDLGGNVCTSWAGRTPGLCKAYTDNPNDGNGHLNKTGQIQVAKALWVLMARLAGWTPDGPEPEETPTWTPIPPTISPLETPSSPTPPPTPCDCQPCPCGVTATATLTPTVVPTSVTVTPMPTALPTATPSRTPTPVFTPSPIPTVAPSPTPVATPAEIECEMLPELAAWVVIDGKRRLEDPLTMWPWLLNGGEVTRSKLTALVDACERRTGQ
jgi:hypothetical protein